MDQRKEKKWWQHLLVIPVMLAVDLLALAAAGMADSASAGDGLGHPVPGFLLAAVLICGVLTVVLVLRAVILCLGALLRRGGQKPIAVPGRRRAVWHCFLPLMIEAPIALIAVIACGYWEISSFYSDPLHVGFAFPITTFLLAGICLLITFFIGLLCCIAAMLRSRRNQEKQPADT